MLKKNEELSLLKYNRNPNIKFNSFINYKNNNKLNNSIFEIYKSFQNNNFYMIIPNIKTNNIEVFYLHENELEIYKILKGQNYEISFIKYYINKKNEEYLLSTDILEQIYIWDITHNYINIQIIKTDYFCTMLSNLLLFMENDVYIITTCCPDENDTTNFDETYSKIYSLSDGNLIRNIKGTNMNFTYYILHWYNIIDNSNYIIECCKGKIYIYNFINDDTYINFSENLGNGNFLKGIIFTKNNNDYLITGRDDGYVLILDLNQKLIINLIEFKKNNFIECQIYHIEKWNSKYFFVYEYTQNSIYFIEFENLKKVSRFKFDKNNSIEEIKIMNHHIYGKSLLISNEKNYIQLWN